MLTTGTKSVRSYVAIGLALALMIIAAVALFVLIQNVLPYVAFIRGQFYTPVPNSSETILNRAFSKTGLVILRLAFWPAVLFILLEVGATYSVSTLYIWMDVLRLRGDCWRRLD